MIRCLSAGFLIAATVASVHAENQSPQVRINNYSHQSMICGTYYVIVTQCLRNRDRADPLIDRYENLSKETTDEAYQAARIAGLSEKAILARSTITTNEMMEDINNSCANISVLNLKHGKSCKAFIEAREKVLNDIIMQMK